MSIYVLLFVYMAKRLIFDRCKGYAQFRNGQMTLTTGDEKDDGQIE